MAQQNFIWRYLYEYLYTETMLIIIGNSTSIAPGDLVSHNDTNCIYVSWAGNDTTGDGTSGLPFRTLQHALATMGGKLIITILDSNEYYSGEGASLFLDLNGITLQGDSGQSPILTIDVGLASQIKMVEINNGAILNLKIVIPEDYTSQVTAVELNSGDIKYTTILDATRHGVWIPSGAGVCNIENSIIKDIKNEGTEDGNGIKFEEGTLNLSRCLLVDNDRTGLFCTGTDTKILNISHATIAGNQYGIHGQEATNLATTLLDSILYDNTIYDYNVLSGNIDYCCVGSINGEPTIGGHSMVRFSPFFIGGGDYRVRTIYNGYSDGSFVSPIIGISSTGIDLGVYAMSRQASEQGYNQFETKRSDQFVKSIKPIEAKMYFTNSIKPKFTKKGTADFLTVNWKLITDIELENLKAMYNSNTTVFLSTDGILFDQYFLNETKELKYARPLNVDDMDLWSDINLELIKI